jgi:hypothetical protein
VPAISAPAEAFPSVSGRSETTCLETRACAGPARPAIPCP